MGLLLEEVTVTTNVACTIYIGNNTSSSGVTSFTAYIPYGTSYTVYCSSVSGYDTPSSQSFTAGKTTRYVYLEYTEQRCLVTIYNSTTRRVHVKFSLKSGGWYIDKYIDSGSSVTIDFTDDLVGPGAYANPNLDSIDAWLIIPVSWGSSLENAAWEGHEDDGYSLYVNKKLDYGMYLTYTVIDPS